jgi:hypothetical protein
MVRENGVGGLSLVHLVGVLFVACEFGWVVLL